jgi:hypothetical protein
MVNLNSTQMQWLFATIKLQKYQIITGVERLLNFQCRHTFTTCVLFDFTHVAGLYFQFLQIRI